MAILAFMAILAISFHSAAEVFPLTRCTDDPMIRLIASQSVSIDHDSLKHRSNRGGHMQLTSSSSPAEGNIPSQFTCEGKDISPELTWKNAPSGTKTFALIVHDPDAPRAGGFTHWVVYNIP